MLTKGSLLCIQMMWIHIVHAVLVFNSCLVYIPNTVQTLTLTIVNAKRYIFNDDLM